MVRGYLGRRYWSMTKLDVLWYQRNQLVDKWKDADGQDKVKLLVQIMDLEEDINEQTSASKGFSAADKFDFKM